MFENIQKKPINDKLKLDLTRCSNCWHVRIVGGRGQWTMVWLVSLLWGPLFYLIVKLFQHFVFFLPPLDKVGLILNHLQSSPCVKWLHMRPQGSCSSTRGREDFSTDGPSYRWIPDLTCSLIVYFDEERIQLISLLDHLDFFGLVFFEHVLQMSASECLIIFIFELKKQI